MGAAAGLGLVEVRVPADLWPRRRDWRGTVVSVKVRPGDVVSRGYVLFEVETEKVVLEIEAPVDGRVVEVRVSAGDEVGPGDLLAVIEPLTPQGHLGVGG